ncbi:MAG TPA: cell wall-binding repeat-containing protein [Thermoplasmatales archaeon]|nr:cell wall-binding repeat-containing protein [Thermoplasmatales archaeon]
MEDWLGYCGGRLDDLILINVPREKVRQWSSRNVTVISGDDPFSIASKIALHDWSYSDLAVIVAIREDFNEINNQTVGEVKGTVEPYPIGHKHFKIDEPVIGTGGTYKSFTIQDHHYKYITAELTWRNRIDLDLQLYDKQLGMVDNAAKTYQEHAREGLIERVASYIHNYGDWEVSVTAVPKKGMYRVMENPDLKFLSRGSVKQGDVDITLYPGVIVDIPDKLGFGCREAEFTLKWNNPNLRMGFTILDPSGTEIYSTLFYGDNEIKKESELTVNITSLGECRENESYSICVFSMDDIHQPVDFTIRYKWKQVYPKVEGDCFTSAANGAVLASLLNAPLLYTSQDKLSSVTKDTLLKLGVKKIYLIDVGGYLKEEVLDQLRGTTSVERIYHTSSMIYRDIRNLTSTDTVVFTTIDPWTYWYVAELKPAGEYKGALFIGPAAYIAAHHGTPVLIVDEHPDLSQAVVYPNDFWWKNACNRATVEPCAGSMYLFGRQVYRFLEENNLGKLEEGGPDAQFKETIITVAGQYDIGAPWDRSFTGAALPGRFFGSPVDTAYFISRNICYPALIVENPAMQGKVKLINGSSSKTQPILGRLRKPYGVNLVITKPSQEEDFKYPILETYNVFLYRFNERGYKHWNFKYTRADGIIPYLTDSMDPIDEDVTDKSGAYYPDISETEVIPIYAKKAGYSNVYSTNFSSVVEDLNRGVILWMEQCHGFHTRGGEIAMWASDSPYVYEPNPWRAYETILLAPSNLREFIHWLFYYAATDAAPDLGLTEQQITKFKQLSRMLINFHLLNKRGSTENPDVSLINTQLVRLNNLFQFLSMGVLDCWSAWGFEIHRDRLLHPLKSLREGLPIITTYDGKSIVSVLSGHPNMIWMNGYDFDDALENLHSCGVNAISCMPALTFLHLTWMRHGMVYQIIDPWTTTDWAAVWNQMLIKLFAKGYTVGEAYERGMRACGPEFLVGQWWWDRWENVELFGDPDLRVFVPSTEYSDENHWSIEDTLPLKYDPSLSIDGHMPFGATSYPHVTTPSLLSSQQILFILLALLVILLAILFLMRGEKNISK